MWYTVIETSFHCIVYNGSVWCSAVNWIMRQKLLAEACGNFLTYLLIAMAALATLTAKTLASMSSVMMVTSYTPLSVKKFGGPDGVWLCVVCVHACVWCSLQRMPLCGIFLTREDYFHPN